MSEEKITKLLKWIPLLMAAGYFAFLIATWQAYLRAQAKQQLSFESALEKWQAERNTTGEPES